MVELLDRGLGNLRPSRVRRVSWALKTVNVDAPAECLKVSVLKVSFHGGESSKYRNCWRISYKYRKDENRFQLEL